MPVPKTLQIVSGNLLYELSSSLILSLMNRIELSVCQYRLHSSCPVDFKSIANISKQLEK